MTKQLIKYVALFMFCAVVFSACDKDDDAGGGMELTAAFEIESQMDLTVTFKNQSMNATSYAWNFGDGSTSSSENPTHTYDNEGTYTVSLVSSANNDSKTVEKSVTVTSPYKTSGYVLTSVASSSGGSTYYGSYLADKPTNASIDMTQKQAFQRIQFKAKRGAIIYGWPTDNTPGLAKLAVDAETEELVTIATLPLFDFPGDVVILKDDVGLLSYFGRQEIDIFNPQTMQLTGKVDLTGARDFPEGDDWRNGYNSMMYNPKTGKIYVTAFSNNAGTPPFYDAQEVWVEVVDADQLVREKTIIHPNAQYPLMRGNINRVIDEEGNTYLLCQGSYGIDGQIGPTAAAGSRPQIIKINTNSEFDLDYAYNPINSIGFENNFFQLLTSIVYAGNNKVIGIGTGQPETPAILALLQKLAAGTLTDAEYDQLVSLVLYDESMVLIEVDLNSKTASLLNAPKTAGFAYPSLYNTGSSVFAQMTANGGSFNGFYEIDLSNNNTSEAINITAGGLATQLIDLSKDF